MECLPDALLLLILASLPGASSATWRSVLCVSKRWKKLAQTPTLPCWAVLDAQRFSSMADPETEGNMPLSDLHMLPIAARCTALFSLGTGPSTT